MNCIRRIMPGDQQGQRERLPGMKAARRLVCANNRCASWSPCRGLNRPLDIYHRTNGRKNDPLHLQLMTHQAKIPIDARSPDNPTTAPHRNVAVSNVRDGRRYSHGLPRLPTRRVLPGISPTPVCRPAHSRSSNKFQTTPTPQLGREEATQSILDQHILLHAPELRGGMRRSLQTSARQGVIRSGRVILQPLGNLNR